MTDRTLLEERERFVELEYISKYLRTQILKVNLDKEAVKRRIQEFEEKNKSSP